MHVYPGILPLFGYIRVFSLRVRNNNVDSTLACMAFGNYKMMCRDRAASRLTRNDNERGMFMQKACFTFMRDLSVLFNANTVLYYYMSFLIIFSVLCV